MVQRMWVAGLDEMVDEVGRIGGQPSFRTLARLEAVLQEAFADTQARTHVITGSLKISGRSSSDWDPATSTWTGDIIYGGEAPGAINNPVDYAIYEMARGGEHDFFGGLPTFDPVFGDAVLSHFDEGVQ